MLAAGSGVARLYEDQCAGRYIEVWHGGVRKWSRDLHLVLLRGDRRGHGGPWPDHRALRQHGRGRRLLQRRPPALRRARRQPPPDRPRADAGLLGRVVAVRTPPHSAPARGTACAAFGSNAVRNDFTVTSGTPTTLLATTTTRRCGPRDHHPHAGGHHRAAVHPDRHAPPRPGRPGRRHAVPGIGRPKHRSSPPPGRPWWVPDPTQLDLLGGWGRVAVAGPSMDRLLSAWRWRPLQQRAFVEAGNGQMWWCAGGSPWPVESMEELAALNAVSGAAGWYRLPGGGRRAAVGLRGGTLPRRGVPADRGATELFVWTGPGALGPATPTGRALGAAGWGGTVNVIPARLTRPDASPATRAEPAGPAEPGWPGRAGVAASLLRP